MGDGAQEEEDQEEGVKSEHIEYLDGEADDEQ